MESSATRSWLLSLGLLLGGTCAGLRAAGESPASVPAAAHLPTPASTPGEAARWSDLHYTARKLLLFSGSLDMTRRTEPYPGDGPWRGKPLLLIETRSGASALGKRLSTTHTRSWIDPATGSTVEYVEHKLRERWKRVTFGADGFRQVVRRPEDGQERQPPQSWPVRQEIAGPYSFRDGTAAPAGAAVRDYYNMIGDLGRLTTAGAEEADYLVVTKGRVVRFRVTLGDRFERPWKLLDLAGSGSVKLPLRLREMTLRPVDEEPADVGGFFAMEGGTEVWVEEETGMVVLIGGEVPKVPGRTEIRLSAAGLGSEPLAEALAD
jgi:hypothetical protein